MNSNFGLNQHWLSADQERQRLAQKNLEMISLDWMGKNLNKGEMTFVQGASLCWPVTPQIHGSFLSELLQVQIQLLQEMGPDKVILVPPIRFKSEPSKETLWHRFWTLNGTWSVEELKELDVALSQESSIPDEVDSALHMTIQGVGYGLEKPFSDSELDQSIEKLKQVSLASNPISLRFWGPIWDVEFAFVMAALDPEPLNQIKKEAAIALGQSFKERPFHVTVAYPKKALFKQDEFEQWDFQFIQAHKRETQQVEISQLEMVRYRDIAFRDQEPILPQSRLHIPSS